MQLFLLAGMLALSWLMRPKVEDQQTFGPRVEDLKVQSSTFGLPIPILYGTSRLGGILIDASDLIEHVHVDEQSAGKGFGGGSQTYTWYSYTCSFATAFCTGPAAAITRVWAGADLIYDSTGASAVKTIEGLTMRRYLGTETQDPDPTLEVVHGVGEVPAYRGMVYAVFQDMDLTDYGNAIPNITAEVTTSLSDEYTVESIYGANVTADAVKVVANQNNTLAFISTDGELFKVDLTTATIISKYGGTLSTNNFGNVHEVDSRGYVYLGDGYPGYNITCVNADTMSEYWRVATPTGYEVQDISYGAFSNIFNGNVIGDSEYVIACFTVGRSLYRFNIRDGTASLFNDTVGEIYRYTSVYQMNDEEYWAVGYNGTVTYLAEFNGNGDLQSLYNLSVGTYTIDSGAYLAYDDVNDCFLIGMGGSSPYRILKFDKTTRTAVAVLDNASFQFSQKYFKAGPKGGKFYTGYDQTILEIDVETMTVSNSWSASLFTGITYIWGGTFHHLTESLVGVCATPLAFYQLMMNRGTGGPVGLDTVVSNLCTRRDSWMVDEQLGTGDIDVTDLAADDVRGYIVGNQVPRRQAIEPLMLAYQFDACLEDEKIVFVKRGGNYKATITEAEMSAHEYGDELPEPLQISQDHELELPCQVSVTYQNPNKRYEQSTQYSRRLTTSSQRMLTLQMSMVLTNTEAAQIAEKILFMAWTGRYIHKFTTSREYLYLSPTDTVYLTQETSQYRVRIEKTNYGAPGLLPFEAVEDNQLDVQSYAQGAPQLDPEPAVRYGGPTRLYLLDCPMFRDNDDDSGFYLAANGYVDSWRGCEVYRSTDNGVSYSSFMALTEPVVSGQAGTALADGPTNVWDEGNELEVIVFNGEVLYSASEEDIYNGANAALLGDDARWEIIQWRTATLTDADSNTYTLSGLLRGRHGTEWATTTHTVGDNFVYLQLNNSIQRARFGDDDIGYTRLYKAVSFKSTLQKTPSHSFSNNAVGLEPYSVTDVAAVWESDDDIVLTWRPRTRYGGEWRDYVDVTMGYGEEDEEYEIEICNSIRVIKRTVTGLTSPTFTYTSAMQIVDFGAVQTEVFAYIYKISSVVGRGYSTWFEGSIDNERPVQSLVFTEIVDDYDASVIEPALLNYLTEDFSTDTQFTQYTENTLGTFSVAANQATIAHTAGNHNTIVTETGTDLTVPQCFASIQVDSGGTGTGAYDNCGVGLAYDEDNFIFASWDRRNNLARIQIKVGGSNTFLGSVAETGWTAPYKVGFSLVGNSACFWKDSGSGWEYITGADVSAVRDFKAGINLSGWKYAFTVASPGITNWVLSNFKVGAFGFVGMRDMVLVSEAYSNLPYETSDGIYFTATAADPLGSSYCGVFRIDMASYGITQTGMLFVYRGGSRQNDLATHIIKFTNYYRVFISTWGNGFGGDIKIRGQSNLAIDLLHGTHLLTSTTELNLPGILSAAYGCYDPHVVWDADNSRWLIAYTITEDTTFAGNPFYPVMAYSTDLSSFTEMVDYGESGYEGTRLYRAHTKWYMMAGGPAGAATTARVHEVTIDGFNYVGNMQVTFDGGTLTQPHPMLFARDQHVYILTFNDTKYGTADFTWGHVEIFRANRYFPTGG